MNTTEVTALIIYPGEKAAGLPFTQWEIDELIFQDDENREAFRQKLSSAFDEITGGGHYVVFTDEYNRKTRRFEPKTVEKPRNSTKAIRKTPFRRYLNSVMNTDGEPTTWNLLITLFNNEPFNTREEYFMRAKGYRFKEVDINNFLDNYYWLNFPNSQAKQNKTKPKK